MKILKKLFTVLIVAILSMVILSGSVNAASTTIRASASKVTVGKNVSVTVSFGEKVSAAQFVLGYDTNKFTYVSCSKGDFSGSQYVYLSKTDAQDLSSVTFTFRAKATGTGTFNVSGLVLPNRENKISKGNVSVEISKATTVKKNTSTTNKVTPTATPGVETPVEISKTELDSIKLELSDLIETDYTKESWKALQDAIAKAESATKPEEYDSIKGELTTEKLVVAPFEKTELNKVLIELIGKVEDDYTEESWKEVIAAVEEADAAYLASEYEEVKDELDINKLEEKDKTNPIVKFFQDLDEQERISLGLAVCVGILLLIIIIMIIRHRRDKEDGYEARRVK